MVAATQRFTELDQAFERRGGLSPDDIVERYGWRPLRLMAVYRLVVAVMLLASVLSGIESLVMAPDQPVYFELFAYGYFLAALALLLIVHLVHRYFAFQVGLHTITDCVLLGLLIYAAGLDDNALAPLMLVSVAVGSALVGLRMAAFFAAVATLALLYQHLVHYLQVGTAGVGYTEIGLLGIALFMVAISGSLLGKRARGNALLAERRGVDLANMEALNGHIVERLRDGVMVVDRDDQVRLMNGAAWNMLGQPAAGEDVRLASLAPQLRPALTDWRADPTADVHTLTLEPDGMELRLRFLPLGTEGGALLFLEDTAEINAQVQQVKLASLGQLTASIAHEIRNPLSAITHAGQLLGETSREPGDERLLGIIQRQGKRLNGIVEDVLRMSRREPPNTETFVLRDWLRELAEELRQQQALRIARLDLEGVDAELQVMMDTGHLNQIITNLVRNTVDHADSGETPWIRFSTGYDHGSKPWLELADNGPGIPAERAERLFEPFFTTSQAGTGLGLYLCRELCEANRARLSLRTGAPAGACFRITFSGPPASARVASNA